MAKAKKLPSGNWRCRAYYTENGKPKTKSFTAETKAEAELMAAQFTAKPTKPSDMTVRDAISRYIELSTVLSPTTLQGYEKVKKTAFLGLMDEKVSALTDSKVQSYINAEVKRPSRRGGCVSAKTVKNSWGLVSTALRYVCGVSFNVKLPKIQRKNEELPEPSEVFARIKGSDIELPCLLAMWMSLSMSEIRGIRCSSIHKDYLSIDRVIVDVNGIPYEKDLAKVSSRIRKVLIPRYVLLLIKQQPSWRRFKESGEDEHLISMSGVSIYKKFKRLTSGMDLSFHDLRHIFASVSLNILRLPDRTVMDDGGWSTDAVMKSVYSQSFSESRKAAAKARDSYFNSILEELNARG